MTKLLIIEIDPEKHPDNYAEWIQPNNAEYGGWCCEAMANFAKRIWFEEKKNERGGFHVGYFFCGYRMIYCPFCGTRI